MDTVNHIKATITAALALLSALWGWFGWLVLTWIASMVIDYITGSAAAWRTGKWSSSVARDGLSHKMGSVVSVIAAGILDLVVGLLLANLEVLPIHYTVLLCPLVIVWYILTEVGSIVENAGKLGADIPPWLRKSIAALQDVVDGAGEGAGSIQKK